MSRKTLMWILPLFLAPVLMNRTALAMSCHGEGGSSHQEGMQGHDMGNMDNKQPARQKTPAEIETVLITVYACPMHSEVRGEKPGKCPKCGMVLESKQIIKYRVKKNSPDAKGNETVAASTIAFTRQGVSTGSVTNVKKKAKKMPAAKKTESKNNMLK